MPYATSREMILEEEIPNIDLSAYNIRKQRTIKYVHKGF